MLSQKEIEVNLATKKEVQPDKLPNNLSKVKEVKVAKEVEVYPKITISLKQYNEQGKKGFMLRVTRKASAAAEEQVFKETLTVANGLFQAKDINSTTSNNNDKASAFKVTEAEKNCCIQFDNGSEAFALNIAENGSMLVHQIETDAAVTLESSQDIIALGECEAKQINFIAQSVVLQTSVTADNIKIKARDILNQGQLTGRSINVDVARECRNQGTFYANEITADGKGFFKNDYIVKADKQLLVKTEHLRNRGLMQGDTVVYKGKAFKNEKNSAILSRCFKAEAVLNIHNEGRIISKERAVLKAFANHLDTNVRHAEIGNTGKIIAGEELILDSDCTVNEGLVAADFLFLRGNRNLRLSGSSLAKNAWLCSQACIRQSGTLTANSCTVYSEAKHSFINQGTVLINDVLRVHAFGEVRNEKTMSIQKGQVEIHTLDNIVQTTGGNITAQNILFDSLKTLTLSGNVHSGQNLESSSVNTLVQKGASVTAENNLSFKALQDLINKAKLQGKTVFLEAFNEILNEGSVQASEHLQALAGALKNAGLMQADGSFTIDTKLCIEQLSNAELEAFNLKISTGTFNNEGSAKAHRLELMARELVKNRGAVIANEFWIETGLLENLLSGIIIAVDELNLLAKVICNEDTIKSQGKAKLIADIIHNLKNGKIVCLEDLKLLAQKILINKGSILAEQKVVIEALEYLLNENEIQSAGELGLKSNYINNKGNIQAEQLIINALQAFVNQPEGAVSANKTLDIISGYLDNEGLLFSKTNLKADIQSILNNRGKISALETVALINAVVISNLGHISASNLELIAKTALFNHKDASINVKNKLHAMAEFALINKGLLQADKIYVQAKSLIANLLGGQMLADSEIKLDSEGFLTNESILNSAGNLQARALIIFNAASGAITATEAINLLAEQQFEQQGFISARNAAIQALILNNSGTLSASQLMLNIQDTFRQCEQGTILASDAVTLITKNLLFFGKLQGNANCSFQASNSFDYGNDAAWACNQLQLMLENGFDFNKPLTILGNLKITTPRDITVRSNIQTFGDFEISTQNLVIENGGIYSGRNIKALVENILKVSKLGHLVSQNDMQLKSQETEIQGAVHAQNLTSLSQTKFESTGKIMVRENAEIQARKITIQSKEAEKSIFMVGGNCRLIGNSDILYVEMGIGGKFNYAGSLNICSEEIDRARKEEEQERQRAKRKKHRDMLRKFGGILVAGGFAFVFPPASFAAFGMAKSTALIVHGAISGALSGAVAGRNVLQGGVEGMLFAGFGLGLDSALKVAVPEELFRNLMVSAGKTAAEAAVHHDNIKHNVLVDFGINALFGQPSGGTNAPAIARLAANNIARAAVNTVAGKGKFETNLLGAVVSTAGSTLANMGEARVKASDNSSNIPSTSSALKERIVVTHTKQNIKSKTPNPSLNNTNSKPTAPKRNPFGGVLNPNRENPSHSENHNQENSEQINYNRLNPNHSEQTTFEPHKQPKQKDINNPTKQTRIEQRDAVNRQAFGEQFIAESAKATIAMGGVYGLVKETAHFITDIAKTAKTATLSTALGNLAPQHIQKQAQQQMVSMAVKFAETVTDIVGTSETVAMAFTERLNECGKQFEQGNYFNAGESASPVAAIVNPTNLLSTGTSLLFTGQKALGLAATTTHKAKQAIKAAEKFTATHTFRSPVTIHVEPGKLYSGIPIDPFKLRKPWEPKGKSKLNVNYRTKIKTQGMPEQQLSNIGLSKPESLLPAEVSLIHEWENMRNEYLKKWRSVDVSDLSLNSQKILKRSSFDNAIRYNMKPDDLAAIFKEGRGVKINKSNGNLLDHRKEWEDSSKSIANILSVDRKNGIQHQLTELYKMGKQDSKEVQLLKEKLSDLSKMKDKYSELIKEAVCQIEKMKSKPSK